MNCSNSEKGVTSGEKNRCENVKVLQTKEEREKLDRGGRTLYNGDHNAMTSYGHGNTSG